MSKNINISEYHIQIGSENIIDRVLSPILGEDPDNIDNKKKAEKELQSIMKEMRVRIGTVLKTDNVSFLFGAGASIKAGGISLATIPKSLEWDLLQQGIVGKEQKITRMWLSLFYKVACILSKQPYKGKERFKEYTTSLSYDNRTGDKTVGQYVDENCSEEYDEQNKHKLDNIFQDITAIEINLEDFLNHLYVWSEGMIGEKTTLTLHDGEALEIKKKHLNDLINKIIQSLTSLLDLPCKEQDGLLYHHQRFIKKVLTRPLNLRRANIFTLNYDTLIEKSADAEGVVLVDGFVGTLRRVFRPESYDLDFYFPAQTTEGRVHRFDRALHLYKLHGSINWHKCKQDWKNPYGLYATFFNQNCKQNDVLIYPSPLKHGQALGLPYSELFRRFGNAIAQPQSVLFAIGYGFGDEHVNALIRQALAIPSFTLVVIDPNPQNDFVQELEKLEDERVWIIKGWKLGTFEDFVQKLLPDLHEEEINTKVMSTFKKLSFLAQNKTEDTDSDSDGE